MQKYFIDLVHKLVELVQPKVVVCMGTQAFNDFTYTNTSKKDKVFETMYDGIPIIGFNRNGNWSNAIPAISELICKKINIQ